MKLSVIQDVPTIPNVSISRLDVLEAREVPRGSIAILDKVHASIRQVTASVWDLGGAAWHPWVCLVCDEAHLYKISVYD